MTKDQRKVYLKEWGSRHKALLKGNYLRFKYGITHDDYLKMFNEQNGKCAICGTHQSSLKRSLAVDHNHETGKVRGLLCCSCNKNLGILENKQFCAKATLYLHTEVV